MKLIIIVLLLLSFVHVKCSTFTQIIGCDSSYTIYVEENHSLDVTSEDYFDWGTIGSQNNYVEYDTHSCILGDSGCNDGFQVIITKSDLNYDCTNDSNSFVINYTIGIPDNCTLSYNALIIIYIIEFECVVFLCVLAACFVLKDICKKSAAESI